MFRIILNCRIWSERDNNILATYWNAEQKCRDYATRFACYVPINVGVAVAALFHSIYCILIGNYDTSAWILPVELIVPFSTQSIWGWYLLWFINFNIMFFYSADMSSITAYFLSCCVYIGAISDHFDLLYNSIVDDVERNQNEKNPIKYGRRYQKIKEQMSKLVEVHVHLFEYVLFSILKYLILAIQDECELKLCNYFIRALKKVADISSASIFVILNVNLVMLASSLYSLEHASLSNKSIIKIHGFDYCIFWFVCF